MLIKSIASKTLDCEQARTSCRSCTGTKSVYDNMGIKAIILPHEALHSAYFMHFKIAENIDVF